jgi:VanZ family protein
MKGHLRILYIAAFCIYLAAVGVLCFIRPSSLPEMDVKTFLGLPIDKVLHFLMFLPYPVLSGLVFINKDQKLSAAATIMLILAITGIGVAYGTEMIQSQTGYRSYEIADFYADMTGIAAGIILAASYIAYTRLKK